jgi:hypothetical protein
MWIHAIGLNVCESIATVGSPTMASCQTRLQVSLSWAFSTFGFLVVCLYFRTAPLFSRKNKIWSTPKNQGCLERPCLSLYFTVWRLLFEMTRLCYRVGATWVRQQISICPRHSQWWRCSDKSKFLSLRALPPVGTSNPPARATSRSNCSLRARNLFQNFHR